MNTYNDVLFYLQGKDYFVPLAMFNSRFPEREDLFQTLHTLSTRYDLIDGNAEGYILNIKGVYLLNNLPEEYKENPIGYYFLKAQESQKEQLKRENEQSEKMRLEIDALRQTIKDYPSVKRQAIIALIIAGASALFTLLQMLLKK